MGDFTGRTAVITGAGGAIGAACARLIAQQGATAVLWDLSASRAEAVAQEMQADGLNAVFVPTDVSNETEVVHAMEQTILQAGVPSLLVTVAAINLTGAIDVLSVEHWDRMMAVNVRGVFLPIKHVVPSLKQHGGAIVNMCSVSAFIGSDGGAPYHTTKGAVLSMTRSLAQELAPFNIRINAVCPGWVDTPFTDAYIQSQPDPTALRQYANGLHLPNRMARPTEVAEAVVWLLSERASFTTGTELFVDGGFMVKQ